MLDEYIARLWTPLVNAAAARGELSQELRERFAWRILLGRDRSVNAFALPGGYLGVHLGLIAVVTSRDELASVLAHELSHVTQRHIARQIEAQGRMTPWVIGSLILGALAGGWVAMQASGGPLAGLGKAVVPVILLAGVLGGMFWAGVVALLRDRFHANEILVSLMLVYVAELLLSYLVYGPWKDPLGYNFPQTKTFEVATQVPRLFKGSRVNIGALLALVGVLVLWVFMFRTRAGWAQQIGGLSPAAARYAGFSSRRAIWVALLVSGACAGLAGALEVAGPIGQLTPYVPVGYGFAAIIVAFVGRLHPVGMVFSAILMSMFYIGGELAQSRLGLPKSLTGVFQGLLLFCLLACDTLMQYRVRYVGWTKGAVA